MIIIKDEDTGMSWAFVATHEGYCCADAKITEILGQGHRAGGDIAKVRAYFS